MFSYTFLQVKECRAACWDMCLCECLLIAELHPTNRQNFLGLWQIWPAVPYLLTQTSSSMRTLGMAVFKQQKVEDFYDIGEELGR